jgi:hypothetical protein
MHSFDWATCQEWRNHKYSYGDKSESSAKSKHTLGYEANGSHRRSFRSIQKFMGQLNKIFNNETVDLVHVSERFKPLSVFLKPMDELVLKS